MPSRAAANYFISLLVFLIFKIKKICKNKCSYNTLNTSNDELFFKRTFSNFSKSLNFVAPSASANNMREPLLLIAPLEFYFELKKYFEKSL